MELYGVNNPHNSDKDRFMKSITRQDKNGHQLQVMRGGILHTDIWFQQIPDATDINLLLKTEILQHQRQSPQIDPMANPGCWRGSREYKGWPKIQSHIIDTVKAIHAYYNQLGPPCAALDNYPDERFEMNYWANINQKGSTNAMHTHSKWHWSGVYYVQGAGTGPIALYSTPYLNQQVTHGLPFGQSFTMDPADGLLLMFPSYLLHEVLVNPSENPRINIAFNVRIRF